MSTETLRGLAELEAQRAAACREQAEATPTGERMQRHIDRLLAGAANHESNAAACLAGAEAWEREQWRPIETAPRTGVFVLAWIEADGCTLCRWDKDWEDWADNEGETVDPTHWMPLPAAPVARTCANCSEEKCHIDHDNWQGPCPEWTPGPDHSVAANEMMPGPGKEATP